MRVFFTVFQNRAIRFVCDKWVVRVECGRENSDRSFESDTPRSFEEARFKG
jgi:hypothetical protein